MIKKLIEAVASLPDWLAGQMAELSGAAAEDRRRLLIRAVEPSLSYREARVKVELALAEAQGRTRCSFDDAFSCFVSIMGVGYRSGVALPMLRAGLMSGIVQGYRSGRAWAQLLAAGFDRDAWRSIGEGE